MNELREEIKLPPMDYGLAAHEQCDVRERQLKSSLAANREFAEYVDKLSCQLSAAEAVNRDLKMLLDVRTIEIKNAEEENNVLLAANREQKAEIEELAAMNRILDREVDAWMEKLASLRASVGEKPEDAWKRGWSVGYIDALNNVDVLRPAPYVAPTLPGEEK